MNLSFFVNSVKILSPFLQQLLLVVVKRRISAYAPCSMFGTVNDETRTSSDTSNSGPRQGNVVNRLFSLITVAVIRAFVVRHAVVAASVVVVVVYPVENRNCQATGTGPGPGDWAWDGNWELENGIGKI